MRHTSCISYRPNIHKCNVCNISTVTSQILPKLWMKISLTRPSLPSQGLRFGEVGSEYLEKLKKKIKFGSNEIFLIERNWSGFFTLVSLPHGWKFQPSEDPGRCFLCLFTWYWLWIKNRTHIYQNISSMNSSSTSICKHGDCSKAAE